MIMLMLITLLKILGITYTIVSIQLYNYFIVCLTTPRPIIFICYNNVLFLFKI